MFKVLVTKPLGRTKIYLATDQSGPIVLHWALSWKQGEWMVKFKLETFFLSHSTW